MTPTKATLQELRDQRNLTQKELALKLGVGQSSLSRIERQHGGTTIAVLTDYIRALGGQLQLLATFPDRSPVEVVGFGKDTLFTELQDLVGQNCEIQPVPPDFPWNRFIVRQVDESLVQLSKGSNGQYLDIPLRRVDEVLPAAGGRLPVVILKGSLRWTAQKRIWEFAL